MDLFNYNELDMSGKLDPLLASAAMRREHANCFCSLSVARNTGKRPRCRENSCLQIVRFFDI